MTQRRVGAVEQKTEQRAQVAKQSVTELNEQERENADPRQRQRLCTNILTRICDSLLKTERGERLGNPQLHGERCVAPSAREKRVNTHREAYSQRRQRLP